MRMLRLEHFKTEFHSARESGFTLIEVLIAVVILSFIAFSTYKMVDSNITMKETVSREDKAIIQGVTAVGRLDSDFTQIYSPLFSSGKAQPTANNTSDVYADAVAPSGNFDGQAKNGQLIPQFKSEDKSTLIIFTQANRRKIMDSKESRFAWVKYSLRNMEVSPDAIEEKRNQAGMELVRQVIATDIYGQTLNWSEVKSQVLMRYIKSLEFSFWDERTKKFVSSIQELNENKNLIRAIKVIIIWVDEDNNEQTIQKVFRVLNPYFNTKQDDLKLGAGQKINPIDPGQAGADDQVVQ
jgi:prepilin-type N-terminal cleavage/methylation domain-containing protein